MKSSLILTFTLSLCAYGPLLSGVADNKASPAPEVRSAIHPPLAPGLVVAEYPRHATQADEKNNFRLPLDEFGKPIGEKFVIESLSPWKWETERNAIASGFLVIEADGDYRFTTRSFYDRNLLMIDDKEVCGFGDGDDTVATIQLKKGRVKILSAGFVAGRGASGITVRWQPPGQKELGPIPPHLLLHLDDGTVPPKPKVQPKVEKGVRPPDLLATHLITVADDFVVEAYKNGVRLQDGQRKLLDELHGATVERMSVDLRPGDWLVFHVVNNHLRWGGAKYFAVAGCLGSNDFGFVSDPASESWSVCDDPARARDFIRQRDEGTDIRAGAIAKPWADGDGHMRKHAGKGFPGKPLWGGGGSTWIKFVAPKNMPKPVALPFDDNPPVKEVINKPALPAKPVAAKALLNPTRWPVQILYAMYGSGSKNADVTMRVKEFVETKKVFFAVDPPSLGIDPIPYWNKSLWIAYVKDGVRREVRRYENEHVLPESFYGPQDAPELAKWLPSSRWRSEKGELQFHADHSATGYGFEGVPTWEALAGNKLRITWSAERKVEYVFDYTWSSFHEAENESAVFHVME